MEESEREFVIGSKLNVTLIMVNDCQDDEDDGQPLGFQIDGLDSNQETIWVSEQEANLIDPERKAKFLMNRMAEDEAELRRLGAIT